MENQEKSLKRTIIFGAGNLGKILAGKLCHSRQVIGYLDSNPDLWGKMAGDFQVLGGKEKLKTLNYDEIIIASTMRYAEIRKLLEEEGVTEDKFNHEVQNKLMVETEARNNFLRDFAKEKRKTSESASLAEGGVFQGIFAREINRYFPDRRLYLFDTFEGFHKDDVAVELENGFSDVKEGYYFETSEETVMDQMPHPENVITKKGHFPETLRGMDDTEKFLFVNLDFDLYGPTYEGLKYFYPRMVQDGVILVHDYFTDFYHGVKKAIDQYEKDRGHNLTRIPIGDGISIAIIANGI